MKFHRPLVNAVSQTLQQIFEENSYADRAVDKVLKQNPKWGARDRRFIAESIYEMVRWWRLINECYLMSVNKNDNLYFNLFAVWQVIKGNELPDWEEFSGIDTIKIIENYKALQSTRKIRESIPDWLDKMGVDELGAVIWEKEIQELNQEAQVVLRVNTLKTAVPVLKNKLLKQGIDITVLKNNHTIWNDIKENSWVLQKRINLEKLTEYQQGLFEIQDASSQLIAPFLELKEGMTVIDACAGAGGKSLHIAALMNNTGNIISMDVENKKLIELKKRAERAGAINIQTRLITKDTINALKNKADRLLLDVPCSGLGVLKRNPDAKWKLNVDFISKIKQTQREIISSYSQMLKPNGIMVYATCSILPCENQHQVQVFLNGNDNFKLMKEVAVMPSYGFDGFYMAALKKLT